MISLFTATQQLERILGLLTSFKKELLCVFTNFALNTRFIQRRNKAKLAIKPDQENSEAADEYKGSEFEWRLL